MHSNLFLILAAAIVAVVVLIRFRNPLLDLVDAEERQLRRNGRLIRALLAQGIVVRDDGFVTRLADNGLLLIIVDTEGKLPVRLRLQWQFRDCSLYTDVYTDRGWRLARFSSRRINTHVRFYQELDLMGMRCQYDWAWNKDQLQRDDNIFRVRYSA